MSQVLNSLIQAKNTMLNNLEAINKQIKDEKKKDWRYQNEPLYLESLFSRMDMMQVECEFKDWYVAKDAYIKDDSIGVFHFVFSFNYNDNSLSFNVDDAKMLIEYLQHKIDFLEE